MVRLSVLVAGLGVVGLALGSPGTFPACTYCACEYGEFYWNTNVTEHYLPGHNMTDLTCQEYCSKEHPYLYSEEECSGDSLPHQKNCSSPCYSGVDGEPCGSIVKGPGDNFCANHKGTCKTPLNKGYASPKCTACFTCECKFGMGTRAGVSPYGVVDDAACKSLCRGPQFGNGNFTHTWFGCGCTGRGPQDCVVYWPCTGGCVDNGSYCLSGEPNSRCTSNSTGTRCKCEIQSSSPATGCGLP